MSEADNTVRREKRHAVLYFSPKNSAAFKELAMRIRSDGGRTTLVWSKQWKGAESILVECRGVVIEKGCANETDIVEAYRRYSHDVEIHFADANGEFTDEDEETEDEVNARADAEAAESRAAIEAAGGETTTEAEPAILDPEGATDDEEEHDDPDATPDAVVEETTGGEGAEPVDPDSDGEDAGTADDSGEAGAEEPVNSG
jgi:hypothetical protein